jgi:hypothetical protein
VVVCERLEILPPVRHRKAPPAGRARPEAIGDGFVSPLLTVYLLDLGHGFFETGVIATATLAGSALLTRLALSSPRLGAKLADRRPV